MEFVPNLNSFEEEPLTVNGRRVTRSAILSPERQKKLSVLSPPLKVDVQETSFSSTPKPRTKFKTEEEEDIYLPSTVKKNSYVNKNKLRNPISPSTSDSEDKNTPKIPGISVRPVGTSSNKIIKKSNKKEKKIRNEYEVKFQILIDNYPGMGFLLPDEEMTIDDIKDQYDKNILKIKVTNSSLEYKIYLIIYFLLLEGFLTKMLGIDASGFAMAQIKMLKRYDDMMLQLGEKWLSTGSSSWPVEISLFVSTSFQALVIIGLNYGLNYIGMSAAKDTILNGITSLFNSGFNNLTNLNGKNNNDLIDGFVSLLNGGGNIFENIGNFFGGGENKEKKPKIKVRH